MILVKQNQPLTIKRLSKVLSRDTTVEENSEIDLIANSGVQFLDFEINFESDKNPANEINFESDDLNTYPAYVKFGKFVKISGMGDHFARLRLNRAQDKYIVDESLDYEQSREVVEEFDSENDVRVLESLKLFNGVWFPVPYFNKGKMEGPANWARARIINLSEARQAEEKGGRYHLTLAFDTTVDNSQDNEALHNAPSSVDIDTSFTFRDGIEATSLLNGKNGISFVSEWIKSIMKEIYPLSTNNPAEKAKATTDDDQYIKNRVYEKHYLNVLAFIKHFFMPNDIQLIHFDKTHTETDSSLDVSLILDIGNSRTCGLLVEEGTSMLSSSDTFPNSTPLIIRDLNAPEHVYSGAFASRIQFQRANFDFNYCSDISSRLDAFKWPSLARVGTEATKLAAMAKGNEGNTGLNSPKRYLWQINDTPKSEWKFNTTYYQTPVYRRNEKNEKLYFDLLKNKEGEKAATYLPVSKFLNSTGDALFASTGDDSQLKANYSGKSAMTFMLIEIILQAMMQMNSYYYRSSMEDHALPRKLKSIVLTTPPSMPDVEREIFRSCAYQAIGVIWKAYGYDPTPANEFHYVEKARLMFPEVPQIFLKWDETLAGQMVYLYNETQRVFNGNCKSFIKEIRRPDADGRFNEISRPKSSNLIASSVSARIASIDIGGGTTDLVIADYSFPDRKCEESTDYDNGNFSEEVSNQNASIQIREVLRDGFKIAGDDLVLDIIRNYIIPKLGSNEELSKIIGNMSGQDVKNRKNRVQTVEQIFSKVAYRILSRIESLEKVPAGHTDISVEGTVEDFILCKDKCNLEMLNNPNDEVVLEEGKKAVDESVIEYLNNQLGKDYDLLSRKLVFDLYQINYDISRGENSVISKCLNYLNTIVNSYCCDVLLLTGRPSKIPGLRRFIERKSSLSPYRIISMHNYKCNGWYPSFGVKEGRIGDPKSTVVVGALLGYTKIADANKLINFRINTNPLPSSTPMRYFGALDNESMLHKNEVLYRFSTKAEQLFESELSEPVEKRSSKYDMDTIFTKAGADVVKNIPGITRPDDDGNLKFNTELPLKLGYRQFYDPHFDSAMLFSVGLYNDVNDLQKVKDTKEWIIPDDVDFTDEYYARLDKELFSKLRAVDTNNQKEYIQECLSKMKEAFDTGKIALESMNSQDAKNIEAQFEASAQKYGDDEANNAKIGGMSKLFGADKKRAELKEQAIANYKASYQGDLENTIAQKKDANKKRQRMLFLRTLSSLLEPCIASYKDDQLRRLENAKKSMTGNVDGKMRYDLKIQGQTYEGKQACTGSPVYGCIKFMRDEDPDNAPSIFLMKIEDATQSDCNKTPIKEFLNLRLKTVSGDDEEYWNNTGLLLK